MFQVFPELLRYRREEDDEDEGDVDEDGSREVRLSHCPVVRSAVVAKEGWVLGGSCCPSSGQHVGGVVLYPGCVDAFCVGPGSRIGPVGLLCGQGNVRRDGGS